MMSRLFANGFHAFLLMAMIPGASSQLLYQLQVRQVYAPATALDEIEASALAFLKEIFTYAPTLDALGAGQICPTCTTFDDDAFTDDYYYIRRHERQLLARTVDVDSSIDQEEEEDDDDEEQPVEEFQFERRTQSISCPSACANSGRKKCRVLGCAYCGGRCARRRDLQTSSTTTPGGLTPTQAKYIEVAINRKLKPYCDGILNCKIKALLFLQNADGTLTQVRYMTV